MAKHIRDDAKSRSFSRKISSEKVTFLGQQILAIERLKKIEEGQTAEFVKEQRNQITMSKTDGDIKLFTR